ncbi:LlaJI family restriction endonuclease [Lelliottia amnigena]|uniref:LlaJI family restriction endonuclease n=1 Tax=Lelliottia amnigena TaxID=61646 RepID=UPI001C5CA15B|nr:LlaJI family restriction endonuclease [Lelliottia amnigena]QXZ19424.1 LlaJI family restriction endonuclease [Lelliottia amnigena]
MEIILHEDRCAVRNLPEHVLMALNSENLLRSDQDKLDFCGIVVRKNRADVFLPRNSGQVAYNEPKKNSASLIQAIHKYTLNRDRSSYTDGSSEKIVGDSFLGLAFTLLNDYVEHGVYVRRTSDIRKNMGKTDWKRTITRIQCYPSNGSLIYLDTLGKKKITYYDDEVTRIHAEVIRELDRLIGWVFFDKNSNISSELAAIRQPSEDSKAKIGMLVKELGNLYADRDMKLMMDLIAYLSRETGSTDSSIVIGISRFHSMWEHMIHSCMIWKFDVNTRLAKPCYKINGEYQIATQKGGRTDTVLRSPDKTIFGIIDAKYYGAENLVNLPGWPDLIKQFFYALALKDIYPAATVYNWFIFPGSKATVESAHLMSPITQSIQDDKYAPIQCEFLEPMVLINDYIAGKKLTGLAEKILHM